MPERRESLPCVAPRDSTLPRSLPRIPAKWKRYLVPQDYARYTDVEHHTWQKLREQTAAVVHDLDPWLHAAYRRGFAQLIEGWLRIPRLAEIDAALAAFGWRTACVDGYVPASVYAGLLSRGVFPVSRHIRRPEHIDFSPMPDLAHDLLGHVPMLVSEQHRQFLRRLARAMAGAESNPADHELYLANRSLAALRGTMRDSGAGLLAAQARVARAEQSLQQAPSVLTQLGRLYLWSMEFGLMGSLDDFCIYGAGLLSSAAETRSVCLRQAVIRDLSLAVVHLDIQFSDLQTTYFVAADYAQLNQILTTLEVHQLNGTHVPGSPNTSPPGPRAPQQN